MEKFLVIFGSKKNVPYDKQIKWFATLEEAQAFIPFSENDMVFQIIEVPKGKLY